MRYFLTCFAALSPCVYAAEQDTHALLRKAIAAHGGKEKLARFECYTHVVKGVVSAPDGRKFQFTEQFWYQAPHSQRCETCVEFDKKNYRAIKVMRDGSGLEKAGWEDSLPTVRPLSSHEVNKSGALL